LFYKTPRCGNKISASAGGETMQKIKKGYKFYLGGADAEMSAIREHLERNNIPFVDWNLKWGAKASTYALDIAGSQLARH
jgi:hypothetical protein